MIPSVATPAVRPRRRTALRPLATSTYLIRNSGKTLPLTIAIVLSVLLVAGIIAMIDSIPLSIKTIYGYSKYMLGIGPRGDPRLTPKIIERIKNGSPVPVQRAIVCRASAAQVRSIAGKWPFVVIGMPIGDMKYFLERMGSRGLEGRMPTNGAPEALVSRPVAKNMGLRLGSTLIGPSETEAYSPYEVKVVGIVESPNWMMLTTKRYHELYHFPPVDVALVFARSLREQGILDRWAEREFRGERAQLFAYHQIERQTNDMFKTLYKILNVVIGTLVLVITFMMGMLMNIYQTQRTQEFGLLQALGYTRRQLLRRVLRESLSVIVAGWLLGMVAAYGLLNFVYQALMAPNAYSLDALDPKAYAYTIPIPIAILSAAIITVLIRFRSFDPVSVVERRLV